MQSRVDTQGLFFSLKLLTLLCGLVVLAYGGGQVVGARVFTDPLVQERSAQTSATLAALQKKHVIAQAKETLPVREATTSTADLLDALTIVSDSVPATSARSLLVADIDTGQIYFEKNATQALPIASVTKLMTALVARENIASDAYIPHEANGEVYHASDLVYPLFLRSDNTAADSFADYYGRGAFLTAMNKKAKELGMDRTHFDDPSGLSPKNVSSAADLYYLVQDLYKQQRPLLTASKEIRKTITAQSGFSVAYSNQNQFAKDSHFVGGKLGFTDEALQTSAGLFSFNIGGHARVIVVIVLGSYDWKQDTRTLVSWFKDSAVPSSHQAKR